MTCTQPCFNATVQLLLLYNDNVSFVSVWLAWTADVYMIITMPQQKVTLSMK